MSAEIIHRLHFAFTITFHYLFPQLTMGLALLIVVLKTVALRTGSEVWDRAARFWGRIFGINFVMGVVTGIPMEFQFGTNWARFARLSGGIIGQPLAMEGVFSFFLESAFLGLFLYGEKRISQRLHWFSAVMVWLGSWISASSSSSPTRGCSIPWATPACPTAILRCSASGSLLLNPWAFFQYMHNMTGAVITGSFVMAAVGAFYLLEGKSPEYGASFSRSASSRASFRPSSSSFPPATWPASTWRRTSPQPWPPWKGFFKSRAGAPIVLMGQPNENYPPDRQSDRGERRA
jgi:cytochrome bd ubiquinol oxidase subunit I